MATAPAPVSAPSHETPSLDPELLPLCARRLELMLQAVELRAQSHHAWIYLAFPLTRRFDQACASGPGGATSFWEWTDQLHIPSRTLKRLLRYAQGSDLPAIRLRNLKITLPLRRQDAALAHEALQLIKHGSAPVSIGAIIAQAATHAVPFNQREALKRLWYRPDYDFNPQGCAQLPPLRFPAPWPPQPRLAWTPPEPDPVIAPINDAPPEVVNLFRRLFTRLARRRAEPIELPPDPALFSEEKLTSAEALQQEWSRFRHAQRQLRATNKEIKQILRDMAPILLDRQHKLATPGRNSPFRAFLRRHQLARPNAYRLINGLTNAKPARNSKPETPLPVASLSPRQLTVTLTPKECAITHTALTILLDMKIPPDLGHLTAYELTRSGPCTSFQPVFDKWNWLPDSFDYPTTTIQVFQGDHGSSPPPQPAPQAHFEDWWAKGRQQPLPHRPPYVPFSRRGIG